MPDADWHRFVDGYRGGRRAGLAGRRPVAGAGAVRPRRGRRRGREPARRTVGRGVRADELAGEEQPAEALLAVLPAAAMSPVGACNRAARNPDERAVAAARTARTGSPSV